MAAAEYVKAAMTILLHRLLVSFYPIAVGLCLHLCETQKKDGENQKRVLLFFSCVISGVSPGPVLQSCLNFVISVMDLGQRDAAPAPKRMGFMGDAAS